MELSFEDLNKDIVKNPYKSIIQWGESILKLVGSKTYPVLALMPISLFSPKIPFENENLMTNIHTLVLSPSGSGKSKLVNSTFAEITHNPLKINRQSAPKFIDRLYQTNNVSVLCGDIDIIFKDPVLMKVLEGMTGEEQEIISSNMARERIFKINGIFLGGGLPSSLTSYSYFGMMRRLFPLVMFHSLDERDEIYDKITDSAFKEPSKDISSESIKNYYNKLINIQLGNDDEFKKITGYVVDNKFVWGIREWHKKLLGGFPDDKYAITELHSGFRFLANSSILNYFNRKREIDNNECKIVIDENDYEVAKQLMYVEMKMKYYIYSSMEEIGQNSSISRLYERVNNIEDNVYKNVARIFLNDKVRKSNKK